MATVLSRAATERGAVPLAIKPAARTVHTTENAMAGPTRRLTRDPSQAPYDTPSRRAADHEAALANPPTKKNRGITWRAQVSARAEGTAPRTFVALRRPSWYCTAAMSQWPNTTTASDATRRKST